MASIQTLKEDLKLMQMRLQREKNVVEELQKRLEIAHNNNAILTKMKSRSQDELYLVQKWLTEKSLMETVLKEVLIPHREQRGEVIVDEEDIRSLKNHNARKEVLEELNKMFDKED